MTNKINSKKEIAIKICGITQLSQAKAIAAMGANAIGLIGVEASPRFIKHTQREIIFSELKKISQDIERVLVVANLNDSDFDLALKENGCPTIVQLHGNESRERCDYLRTKYKHISWWKALRIKEKEDLSLIHHYKNNVDALLIDAWSPNRLGGTGSRVPLNLLNQVRIDLPWWVAGGISEEWIPQLLKEINPYGIDASSRLEVSPGIKDLKKVRSMIEKVRTLNKNPRLLKS